MAMKSREAERELNKDGWVEVRQSGGHKIFKHPTKGTFSLPVHPGDLSPGLERALKKALGQ